MDDNFNPYAVRLARRAREMSQADLVREVGVSQVTVSHWEKGQRIPEQDV